MVIRFWCLLALSQRIIYPYWRLVYFCFLSHYHRAVFAFFAFTTFGMVVRAGMAIAKQLALLGINIDKRFTIMFGIAACCCWSCWRYVRADQLS